MTDAVEIVTAFASDLRSEGVNADRARVTTAVAALALLETDRVDDVYWATRLALCSEPDDLPKFDALFDLWFRREAQHQPAEQHVTEERPPRLHVVDAAGAADDPLDDDVVEATTASATEVLRRRDLATLTSQEREEVNRLIAMLVPRLAQRRTPRWRRGGADRVDVRRTMRALLRGGGELAVLRYTRPRQKPRRLVLLVDVSGSMAPYADSLLRFAHAAVRAAPAGTEVFTIGTRLTRITRQLRHREPNAALAAAATAIPDWSGGTRLGEVLRAFLDLWGQRGTARRALVVVFSDGWERGDAALLGEQMSRLARLAYRVVWVNPHKGKHGFAPETAGMVAALPHVDELVSGHSLTSLHNLVEVIAHA